MKWKCVLTATCVLTVLVVAGTAFCAGEEKKEEERPGRPAKGERGWASPDGRPGMRGDKGMAGRGQGLQRVMERLKENNPEKYEELMKLREENPELLHQRLREFGKKLGERRMGKAADPELREKMKETMELEEKAQELGSQYRQAASEEEKEKAVVQIMATVVKIFDIKLAAQEKGVKNLEKKLRELKELLEKRKAARDEIIQKRVDWLTGKNKHLEW